MKFFPYKAVGYIGCKQLVFLEMCFKASVCRVFIYGVAFVVGQGKVVVFCFVDLFSTIHCHLVDYKVDTYYLKQSYIIWAVQSQIKMLICVFPSQDLPEFFEDNMETWMTNFHTLLTLDNKLLQTDVSTA